MNDFRMRDQFPTFGRVPVGLCRACKRAWKGALAVLLLLAVMHGAATLVIGRKLEAELARIKADGDPVSAAELAGPLLPDYINGAVVYEKAFKLIQPEYPKKSFGPRDDCDFLLADNHKDPDMWAKARKIILEREKALPLIEKAAAMPECRFKWKNGYTAMFTYLGPMRSLANLISLRAVVQATDGDMAGAARSIELILNMSYAIKDEPYMYGQLIRQGIIKRAAVALEAAMGYGQFSDTQARSLSDAFSKVDLGPGFVTAMKGQRALIITTFDNFRRDFSLRNFTRGEIPLTLRVYLFAYPSLGKPIFYYHQLESLRFMRKQIDLSGLTYRQTQQLDLSWMNKTDIGPLDGLLFPKFTRAHASMDNAMMYARGSQIILSLQSYKRHFAAYPASLAELKAKIHWELKTEDIFSGKDFIYGPAKQGFILYSVGPDQKDDGGMNLQSGGQTTMPRGDIVWKMDH